MMRNSLLAATVMVLASCATLNPIIDSLEEQEAECKARGGAFILDQGSMTARCVMPEPEPGPGEAPQPEPPPDPVIITDPVPDTEPPVEPPVQGEWITLSPGQSVTVDYRERMVFQVQGIDSRKVKEWHLFDYWETSPRGEVANAHFMVYGCQNRIIKQTYRPLREQHKPDDLCFQPDRAYLFIVDLTMGGFRVQIFENGTIPKVDMYEERYGERDLIPWVLPFSRIDRVRIGAGTFSGYNAPHNIQLMVE